MTTEPQEFGSAVSSTASLSPLAVPSDTGAESGHAMVPAGSGLDLRVTRDAAPTRRLRINAPRCTFGSGDGCTVRLSDASLRPLHAVILHEPGRVLIRGYSVAIDVNGQAVMESTLSLGDVFQLGCYCFELIGLPDSEPDSRAIEREAEQAVDELLSRIASLTEQMETLTAAAETDRATAREQHAELRAALAASQQAEEESRQAQASSRKALSDALQQRDKAFAQRTAAIDTEQAVQAKLRQANQQIQQLQHELNQTQQFADTQLDQLRSELVQLREENQRLCRDGERLKSELASLRDVEIDQPAADNAKTLGGEKVPSGEQAPNDKPAPSDETAPSGASDKPQRDTSDSDEDSVEAHLSRLLQRVARAPGDDLAAERLPPRAVAQQDRPAPPRRLPDPSQHRRAAPSQPVRTPQQQSPAFLNLLQSSLSLICGAIFVYCALRNPALKVVWLTAGALACGLAMFFLYDLIRLSVIRRTRAAASSGSGPR